MNFAIFSIFPPWNWWSRWLSFLFENLFDKLIVLIKEWRDLIMWRWYEWVSSEASSPLYYFIFSVTLLNKLYKVKSLLCVWGLIESLNKALLCIRFVINNSTEHGCLCFVLVIKIEICLNPLNKLFINWFTEFQRIFHYFLSAFFRVHCYLLSTEIIYC